MWPVFKEMKKIQLWPIFLWMKLLGLDPRNETFFFLPFKKKKKPIRFLRVENDMRNFNAITSLTQLFAHVSLSVLNYIFSWCCCYCYCCCCCCRLTYINIYIYIFMHFSRDLILVQWDFLIWTCAADSIDVDKSKCNSSKSLTVSCRHRFAAQYERVYNKF